MASDTLARERERLFKALAGKPAIVHVPEMSFVMIDGQGDPNTSRDYKDAIEALYALSSSPSRRSRESSIGWARWRVCSGPRTSPHSTAIAGGSGCGRR
jgi:hypothetical protein